MPLYTPNAVTLAPPDLDWDGSSRIARAIAHPALPIVPDRIETFGTLRPGIAGEWLSPPPAVMAAMWSGGWRLEASITGQNASFTVDVEMTGVGSDWRTAMGVTMGVGGLEFEYAESQTEIGDDERNNAVLGVRVAPLGVFYAWGSGMWWPGIEVFIVEQYFPPDDAPSQISRADIGDPGDGAGASGVTLTLGADVFTLQKRADHPFALNGTITLTPLDPIEVL
jgi:hypothetical protein